ncbi:MAG: 50S ribosomal protein L10 [Tissierellia bacterium]|nr:50S ribosomal protein L10 [Tissierellia bacterium]
MNEKVLMAKKENVEEIKEKIQKAQTIVLMDYRGLNVEEVTELRTQYRKEGVDYKVYKNTMMRFAFKDLGLEDFNEYLTGPNAVAFGYDDVAKVAKVSSDFAKKNDKLEIKAGIIEGKIASKAEIDQLASLPSKEVLLTQLLGGLNAPIQGFVNVINGPIRGLAIALNQIAETKVEA